MGRRDPGYYFGSWRTPLYEFLVKSDYDNPESCEMDVWVRELMDKTYVMFEKGGVSFVRICAIRARGKC